MPTGTWYNLLNGETIKSDGTKRTVSAEVDETPAFIQSGTVLPIDISSKTWTLTDSMKNVNTRTKALLVTPAQNGAIKTTEWWQDEAEKQVYSSTTNEDSHTISASQGEKAKVLITYGISTSQVVVDGEWLNQLSEKPTGEKSGFYIDEVTNQTIIILPCGTWEEVKIVAEKSWDYAFTADVRGESVSYLNKTFDVYQYSKPATVDAAKAIVGPVEPTDKDPNSSQASYSYFTTQVYGKNSRGGLKPTSIQGGNGKGYTTLTYAVECLENFEAEYEFYGNTGQVFGLAFGAEKGVFPVSLDGNNTNDSGVMLYMESSGKLQVCGAISTATATATGDVTIGKDSTASWYSNIAGAANIYGSITGIDEITQEASVSDTSATFTVCIKVQNKKMTIYEKNHSDMSVTVWLTDQYQGGHVSLISDNWEHGAFKGFRIKNTEWDYSISATLGGQSVAYLNKMFDVYQFANPLTESATQSTVGPVEPSSENSASIYNETKTHFTTLNIGTTAKGGLRPTSVPSSGFTVLTYTKEKMTNFEAEYEIYGNNSQEFGIMFGTDKGEFAVSLDGDNNNDTGVILATREDGKDLFVGGIIDNAKAKVDGATPTIAKNVSSKWFPHFQDVTNVRVQAMFSGLQAVKETVTDSSPTQTFHIKVSIYYSFVFFSSLTIV